MQEVMLVERTFIDVRVYVTPDDPGLQRLVGQCPRKLLRINIKDGNNYEENSILSDFTGRWTDGPLIAVI